MTQSWPIPIAQQDAGTYYGTTLPQLLSTLKTDFAGPNEPTSGVEPYSLWADTTSMTIKRRNAANTAWIVESRLLAGPRTSMHAKLGDGSATRTLRFAAPEAGVISSVSIVSSASSAGSSGADNYALQLRNVAQAIDYFTAAPTTEGDEISHTHAWKKVPDGAVLTVGEDEVLELTFTVNGGGAGLSAANLVAKITIEAA